MDHETRRSVTARLKRVEGQIQGLTRMIEADDSCGDVLVQIAAAQGALGAVGEIVLGNHIRTCVSEAFARGDREEGSRQVEELMGVFARYSRIGSR